MSLVSSVFVRAWCCLTLVLAVCSIPACGGRSGVDAAAEKDAGGEGKPKAAAEVAPVMPPTTLDLATFVNSFALLLKERDFAGSYEQTSAALRQRMSRDDYVAAMERHYGGADGGTLHMSSTSTGMEESRGGKPWRLKSPPQWPELTPADARIGHGLNNIRSETAGYLYIAVLVAQEENQLRVDAFKLGGDDLARQSPAN